MTAKLHHKLLEIANSLFDCAGKQKHFTFICDGNKVISVGWNKPFKTHPLAAKFGHRFANIHSELDAINNFMHPVSELKKYNLINIRLLANRQLAMSKPCIPCQYMLASFGVDRIMYSTCNGFTTYRI